MNPPSDTRGSGQESGHPGRSDMPSQWLQRLSREQMRHDQSGTVCSCHVQIGSNWLETPETEDLVSRADVLVSIAVVGSRAKQSTAQPRAPPAEKGLSPAAGEGLLL